MIILGGYLFWFIILAFCVMQCGSVYSRHHGASFLALLALIVILGCGLSEYPTVDQIKWLALYPLGCIIWAPIWWYLELKRNAKKVKSKGGLEAYYRNRGDYYGCYSGCLVEKLEDGYRLKHPPAEDISLFALTWPVSAPIYLMEDLISWTISLIRSLMDSVRDGISSRI